MRWSKIEGWRGGGCSVQSHVHPRFPQLPVQPGHPPLHERGSSRFSVEEGLIRSIAVDAVGYGRNVLYDQTLARNAGIGRLYNQTHSCRTCAIRGTSNASVLPAILIAPSSILRTATYLGDSSMRPLSHLLPRSSYLKLSVLPIVTLLPTSPMNKNSTYRIYSSCTL